MDDYNWDLDFSDSDLSVDDILAEFEFDGLSADEPVPAEAPAFTMETAADSEALPELPTRYDEQDTADWTASDPVSDEAVEEFLHGETEDILPPDEDEEREPQPPRRRERSSAAPQRKGFFASLLNPARTPARRERGDTAVAVAEDDDYYVPSDEDDRLFSTDRESTVDISTTDDWNAPADSGAAQSVSPAEAHGGSIGQMEREARDIVAQMQAEAPARERKGGTGYTYDLDDLLGMRFDEEESAGTAGSYRPRSEEPEIDERFNLSGQRQQATMSYGGSDIDLSPDDDYIPAEQTGYNPSQWTPDYDDPLAEREDNLEPERKKHKSLFGRRAKSYEPREREAAPAAEEASAVGLTDSDAEPADYAPKADYTITPDYIDRERMDEIDFDEPADADEDDGAGERRRDRSYKDSELYVPPTFREYVLSLLASAWLRVRGTVRGATAETMADSTEDLGPEVTPAAASRYYGSFLRSMKYRTRIAGVLLALLCYVSLEAPVPGMLKTLPVAAALCFGMQAAIMLLALDVVTNGVTKLFRLRVGADSLAVITCLFTGLDALIVALSDSAALHMPLCAISSAAVVGLLLSAYLSARGLRKATRVPAIGKHFYAVTGEAKLKPGEITLLKSMRSAKGFVRRAEEAAPDETLYGKIALPLLALALLMTIIVMVAKKSYAEFIYILSAMLSLTVPFGAMLSFSLPFFLGSTRIFRYGAAIAGWSGLCDIGVSKNLIVTDRDLFPENAVTIDSVRIFADEDAQKVISYAGTMMSASGCCASGCFVDLMSETGATMRAVENFEFLPGGGMKGIIEGHVVLCGSTDLMRLMNVRIPFRLTDKTTVLLAIDGILYGIFALKYEGQPQIREALVSLMRSAHPPVFAVRDFNINPEMLHNIFDLPTDGYDFPPFAERFDLSEPSDDPGGERIAAILCNEGLGPLISVSDVGKSMYNATRLNVLINAVAAVIGVLTVFIRFLAAGSNSLASLFFYMLFWTLPVLAVSFYVSVKK